jgi:hypothetical protein
MPRCGKFPDQLAAGFWAAGESLSTRGRALAVVDLLGVTAAERLLPLFKRKEPVFERVFTG